MVIDKEFQSLIPPLSAEEYKQLEENCIKDGIRDSLIVWDNNGEFVLIDGHNRYEIAQKHGLQYNQKRMTFSDRREAIEWIILNQFGRRNLSAYDRSILALKLKPVIAEKAEERMKAGKHDPNQKSDEGMTSKQLGKIAGVSHDTIHKVEVIQQKAPEKIKEQIKNGNVSINSAYNMVTGRSKSQAQEKKEYLQQVAQRHEEYKEKQTEGVVLLADAQKDKRDKQILARNLYVRLLKMGVSIDSVVVDLNEKDISIKEMAQEISPGDMKTLLVAIRRWASELKRIEGEITQ